MSEQLDLFGHKVGLKEIKRTKAEVFEDYNSFVDKFATIRESSSRESSSRESSSRESSSRESSSH